MHSSFMKPSTDTADEHFAGEQHSIESRKLPNLERFTGKTMYAGKQADAKNYLDTHSAAGKVGTP